MLSHFAWSIHVLWTNFFNQPKDISHLMNTYPKFCGSVSRLLSAKCGSPGTVARLRSCAALRLEATGSCTGLLDTTTGSPDIREGFVSRITASTHNKIIVKIYFQGRLGFISHLWYRKKFFNYLLMNGEIKQQTTRWINCSLQFTQTWYINSTKYACWVFWSRLELNPWLDFLTWVTNCYASCV